MSRGDVYLADLNPSRGSEQAGIRPVVIVQRETLNRFTRTRVVVPLTTNLRRTQVPGTTLIPAGEGGLAQDSVALCYQTVVVDEQRLIRKLGSLSPSSMLALDQALNTRFSFPESLPNSQPLQYLCQGRFSRILPSPSSVLRLSPRPRPRSPVFLDTV